MGGLAIWVIAYTLAQAKGQLLLNERMFLFVSVVFPVYTGFTCGRITTSGL